MLSRAVARGAPRPVVARQLVSASRPSHVALGKRPVLPPRAAFVPAIGSSRNLSWAPWRSTPTAPQDGTIVDPATNPDFASAHPDLLPASTASPPQIPTNSAATGLPPQDGNLLSRDPSGVGSSDPTPLLPQPPADAVTPTLEDMIVNSGLPLEEILNSPEAVHAAIKMSDLKLLGLEHGMLSLPGWVIDALVSMHLATGLPWWGSIAALTVGIRLCLLPLIIRSTRHNVRLAAVQPQMTAIMKRLSEAKSAGQPEAQQVATQTLQNLMKEHDVSPFRPFLMLFIQFPFFIGMFGGLRRLADLPLPQLKEGGFGWVTDLTVADPYFILPLTSMVFTNLVIRVGADGTGATTQTQNMNHLRNVVLIATLVSIPVVGRFPAALLFYWTFTNCFSLIQASILKTQLAKRLFKIPSAPVLPPAPGAQINAKVSFRQTFDAIWNAISNRAQAARTQAEARLAEQERAKGLTKGTALLTERIRESGAKQAQQQAQLPLPPPPGRGAGFTEESPLLKREADKARRIEEARRKRASQR